MVYLCAKKKGLRKKSIYKLVFSQPRFLRGKITTFPQKRAHPPIPQDTAFQKSGGGLEALAFVVEFVKVMPNSHQQKLKLYLLQPPPAYSSVPTVLFDNPEGTLFPRKRAGNTLRRCLPKAGEL